MLALALLAGCGGEEREQQAPKLPRAVAADLAARSESVATRLEEDDPCGARSEAQRLQADTIDAVNDRRIPRRYQEELLASVNALADSIECTPPPPPVANDGEGEDDDEDEDDESEDKPDKGKGKKKGKSKD